MQRLCADPTHEHCTPVVYFAILSNRLASTDIFFLFLLYAHDVPQLCASQFPVFMLSLKISLLNIIWVINVQSTKLKSAVTFIFLIGMILCTIYPELTDTF